MSATLSNTAASFKHTGLKKKFKHWIHLHFNNCLTLAGVFHNPFSVSN